MAHDDAERYRHLPRTTRLRSRRLSADPKLEVRAVDRAKSNLRLALVLGSVALAVFVGVLLKYWVLR
jgi:hypothetical protein